MESLLDTNYSIYEHEDGSRIVRAPEWYACLPTPLHNQYPLQTLIPEYRSLPQHLHEHVEIIQPTNSFFRPRPKDRSLKLLPADIAFVPPPQALTPQVKTTVEEACNITAVTPNCLRTLYGQPESFPFSNRN